MNEQELRLRNAPIVEAVIDIDCDMPPSLDVKELEDSATALFQDCYPKTRPKVIRRHTIESKADAQSEVSVSQETQAIQLLNDDENQIVQVRNKGFSFNRLAPYTSLDDYLVEIKRTWGLFLELVSPVQIRAIRLRYINRLPIPTINGSVNLDEYFVIAPHLPCEDRLSFAGFLNRHTAIEDETGNEVNIVLAYQAQLQKKDTLQVIFDITAAKAEITEPDNWDFILSRIQSLRILKNQVFAGTLTEKCLKLFQ